MSTPTTPHAQAAEQDSVAQEGAQTRSESSPPREESAETTPSDEAESSNSPSREASPSTTTPETVAAAAVTGAVAAGAFANGDWQAIWSPQHNAYYFYNSKTQETTWTNPLQGQPETSQPTDTSSSSASSSLYERHAAAIAAGIDPALAHLDPTLAAGPSAPQAMSYAAKFNARTGAFTRVDARDPTHLSEYERAKRMSEFYFDVNQWEKDLEAQQAEEEEALGKKRKKPTRKDLERFKEQKKQKKLAKTAWLRT